MPETNQIILKFGTHVPLTLIYESIPFLGRELILHFFLRVSSDGYKAPLFYITFSPAILWRVVLKEIGFNQKFYMSI